MQLISLLSLVLLSLNLYAQDPIGRIIEEDAANNAANNAAANAPAAPRLPTSAISDSSELIKIWECLSVMPAYGAVKTDEFASSGRSHFIFRSPNPRSFIMLIAGGMYNCQANWPRDENTKFPNVQFSIEGQLMQPYGPSSNDLKDVTNKCESVRPDGEEIQKFRNRVAINLKYLASAAAEKGSSKSVMKTALRGVCGWHQDFDKQINAGFGSSVPAGVTVQPGNSVQ